MNKNDNLNQHKYVDTFFMTDSQLRNAKKSAADKKIGKNMLLFFGAVGLTILGGPIGTAIAGTIATPALAGLAAKGCIIGPGLFAMSRFIKLFKGGEEVRNELYNTSDEKEGKTR